MFQRNIESFSFAFSFYWTEGNENIQKSFLSLFHPLHAEPASVIPLVRLSENFCVFRSTQFRLCCQHFSKKSAVSHARRSKYFSFGENSHSTDKLCHTHTPKGKENSGNCFYFRKLISKNYFQNFSKRTLRTKKRIVRRVSVNGVDLENKWPKHYVKYSCARFFFTSFPYKTAILWMCVCLCGKIDIMTWGKFDILFNAKHRHAFYCT